ncbi:MAG: TetR/AcrR family transcriptional regulator [Lachnospiraceae bacterium]|nr:TetR/AcrR family transcriptional regulator [Lachnospiraceae bacterium]
MGEKSEQKKEHILGCARKVFVEKGFRSVTMKDIVEASEISRGGLYLYFSNTAEIFLEVLKRETEADDDVFSVSISEDATATDILLLFFKEQKKELLRRRGDLSIATYEFYFARGREEKENHLRDQYDAGVRILKHLIDQGIASGEFYEVDSSVFAGNIMLVIEGLKILSRTRRISEKLVDTQFAHLLQQLCMEDE